MVVDVGLVLCGVGGGPLCGGCVGLVGFFWLFFVFVWFLGFVLLVWVLFCLCFAVVLLVGGCVVYVVWAIGVLGGGCVFSAA